MARYVTRRVMLSLITLWLIVTIVFVIVSVLPGNVGRKLAGPFAPQETVDQINERLGTNDPLPTLNDASVSNAATCTLCRSTTPFRSMQPWHPDGRLHAPSASTNAAIKKGI